MKQKKFRSLNRKLLMYVSFSAMLLLLFTTCVSFFVQYERSKAHTIITLEQLLDTVEDTAVVSAYSKNAQIAQDILSGLLKNDVVNKVRISSNGGYSLEETKNIKNDMEEISRPITSLFDDNEVIGHIYIQPSDKFSLLEAEYYTLANVISAAFLIGFTSIVIFWVMQKFISNPLVFVSNSLEDIRAGRKNEIAALPNNKHDELSVLRKNINSLVVELEERLNQEKALKNNISKINDQLAYEKEVIENVILKMNSTSIFESKGVRKIERPVENISGDITLSALRSDQSKHILLGDFTGHGLTAAIGGPVVFDVFYSMTAKNLPMVEIVKEVSRQLLRKLPTGLFLGVIFLELDAKDNTLTLWNCGMSDVLVYRNTQLFRRYKSSAMALGIVEQELQPTCKVEIQKGDKIFLFSDGITEVINNDNEEFGQDRLEEAISELLQGNFEIDFLYKRIENFMGEAQQFDDVSLLELTG